MKKKSLAAKVYAASNIRGSFLLRSGQVSDEYFDKYLFEADPILLKRIAKRMAKLIPDGIDSLAALEMGGIPVGTMISHYSRQPCLFVRKAPKEYGTRRYAEGGEYQGKKLLIIEDVVTSGGAILDAVKKLRADGALVERVLCVIDRESGGRERLAQNQLELVSLFTKSELEKAGMNL